MPQCSRWSCAVYFQLVTELPTVCRYPRIDYQDLSYYSEPKEKEKKLRCDTLCAGTPIPLSAFYKVGLSGLCLESIFTREEGQCSCSFAPFLQKTRCLLVTQSASVLSTDLLFISFAFSQRYSTRTLCRAALQVYCCAFEQRDCVWACAAWTRWTRSCCGRLTG